MDPAPHPQSSSGKEPRSPRRNDLSRICAELNRLGARYIVIGGFAIIEAGYPRFTGDIDLLIDAAPENEALVFKLDMFAPFSRTTGFDCERMRQL